MEATARKTRAPIHHDEALSVAQEALSVAKTTDTKLDHLILLLGNETEDGVGGYLSTGLVGRVRRAENCVKEVLTKYQRSLYVVTGFTAAFGLVGGIVTALWAVIQPNISITLH